MFLRQLELVNFRNIAKLDLADMAKSFLIYGDNGQGKTNLLEAIHCLGGGSSFRSGYDTDVIRRGEDSALARGVVVDDGGLSHTVKWIFERREDRIIKKGFWNEQEVSAAEMMSRVPIVSFAPDEVDLLRAAALKRRKVMDGLLSRIDEEYKASLLEYYRIWRQRNQMLLMIKQQRSRREDLDIWDERMAEAGAKVVAQRQSFLVWFSERVAKSYKLLASRDGELRLVYQPNIAAVRSDEYRAELDRARVMDIARTFSTRGAHRDDLRFWLGDRDLINTGSRGEFRSLVLAWKMAEAEVLAEKIGRPIVLLDDVLSELDVSRREALLSFTKEWQVFITTTDLVSSEVGEMDQLRLEGGVLAGILA